MVCSTLVVTCSGHDDVIRWKHFPRHWPFAPVIHRSPVNSPHKGQWRGALMFPLVCAWINSWENNREAGDLRRHGAHYDVISMAQTCLCLAAVCLEWSLSGHSCWPVLIRLPWRRIYALVSRISIGSDHGTKPLSKSMLGCCQLEP